MEQETNTLVRSLINLSDLPIILSATAAIGTASFGIMDASKAIKGGMSNWGFGFIPAALAPVDGILADLGADAYALARANWLNGVAKENQKMAIRNMIRLGLNKENASRLDARIISVSPLDLANAADKARQGQELSEVELGVLARFDAMIDLRLDLAFEQADQRFRNASRLGAAIIAVILSLGAAFTVLSKGEPFERIAIGLVVGLVAVPLAPVAKDISSAITTAVNAFKSIRK